MNKYSKLCLILADIYNCLPAEGFFSFWAATRNIPDLQNGEVLEFVHAYNKLYPRSSVAIDFNYMKVRRLEKMAAMTPAEVQLDDAA